MSEEKRTVFRPGIEPDTELGSKAGETYHYRNAEGDKMDPPVYVYPTTTDGVANGGWGGEGPNYEIVFGASRTEVQDKLEVLLVSAGYRVPPAPTISRSPDTIQDPRAPAYGATTVYFPTADVRISAPNVEIGVTVPDRDGDSDGEGLMLTKPGSVMLVGGDIQNTGAGYQPTICHLIDHASGETFSIPPYITDQEVMALVQARRQYVRDNLRQGPPDAAPDNDEMVN